MLSKEYPFLNTKYAISVCRIEPENNIHLILEAFAEQRKKILVLIGNWKNSSYGLHLLNTFSSLSNFYLLDAIYDPQIVNFLRSHAIMYIHGHSAGGTNPSLVEAMFLGLPVFAFDCVYNKYTTEGHCVYWSNAQELSKVLEQSDESKLHIIGEKMKHIADVKYRWDIISAKYEELFI
jgi:glycosyltransferase involved in cell wall biosynthesis